MVTAVIEELVFFFHLRKQAFLLFLTLLQTIHNLLHLLIENWTWQIFSSG